jgi:hypothetical protein
LRPREILHALVGIKTAGSATTVEIADSLNKDPRLGPFAYFVPDLLAKAVTMFPRKTRDSIRVIGGNAQTILGFPGGPADWKLRKWTALDDSKWDVTYDAPTRTLVITNLTGGKVVRFAALVRR